MDVARDHCCDGKPCEYEAKGRPCLVDSIDLARAERALALAGTAAMGVVEEWIKGEIDGIKRPRTRAENIAALRELFGVSA